MALPIIRSADLQLNFVSLQLTDKRIVESEMTMQRPLVFLSLLLLMAGCAKMPICESKWKQSSGEESSFRFYDAKSLIRYNIENDGEFLYVSMDVLDAGTKLRMLRTGSRLIFAEYGKRKTLSELHFPLVDDQTPIRMNPADHNMMPRDGSVSELKKLLPKEGFFLRGDTTNIPLIGGVEQNGFLVKMDFDEQGALVYSVKIPLAELQLSNSFSLGFETGAFNIDDPEYEKQLRATGAEGLDRSASFSKNRGMGGNPNNNIGSNQPYGNVAQPGQMGAPYRSAPPRLGQRSALSDALYFWVKVELKEEETKNGL